MEKGNTAWLILLIGLITLTVHLSVPVDAFGPFSFTSETGDEYFWTVQTSDGTFSFMSAAFRLQGDRLKITIDVANQSVVNMYLSDTIYGAVFNRSPIHDTWTLWDPTYRIAFYNPIEGYGFYNVPFFIPRNQTAVNATMNPFLRFLRGYDNYQWLSGAQGYDGVAIGYDGSINGDLGETKEEWDYNEAGILVSLKVYQGTGPGWSLYYHLELDTEGIPGFSSNSALIILAVIMGMYVVLNKKQDAISSL